MTEHDPLDELRALADDAERLVDTPMPAAWLRHRGAQRHRRRITAMIVAAFLALAISGGGVYSAIRIKPQPSPAQTPGITATKAPSPDALPTATPTSVIVESDRGRSFVPNPPATRTPFPTRMTSPTPPRPPARPRRRPHPRPRRRTTAVRRRNRRSSRPKPAAADGWAERVVRTLGHGIDLAVGLDRA